MKSRLPALVLVMSLFFAPVLVPVAAQSNHTLEWGADVGEEFIYVLQREHYSDASNMMYMESQLPFLADIAQGEKVILEISSLETIENLINESTQLPRSYCNLNRFNDSALIMADLMSLVLPIGDWEFLTETNNVTITTGITFIDNEDEWGTLGVGIISVVDGSLIDVRIEMRYEKENGTLSYLRHRYTTLGTDIIDVIFVHWYPGMPTIIGGDIQLTTILIMATSGIVGLIVAFVVYRGIKGKKKVVQRLGE
ncbi:MAG: hypothetical protein E3J86_05685 [Candidatus Thorarchaeota archaeon]|nr:MAG: hypothetical protein E3J86_05685 [Candidatus Thorarchaeota archaeon]